MLNPSKQMQNILNFLYEIISPKWKKEPQFKLGNRSNFNFIETINTSNFCRNSRVKINRCGQSFYQESRKQFMKTENIIINNEYCVNGANKAVVHRKLHSPFRFIVPESSWPYVDDVKSSKQWLDDKFGHCLLFNLMLLWYMYLWAKVNLKSKNVQYCEPNWNMAKVI